MFSDGSGMIQRPFGSLYWWTAMCWRPAVMYRQSGQGSLCQSLRLPGACLVCKQRGATRLEKYAHHDLSLSLWNVWITQARSRMCTYTPGHGHTHPHTHTHTHRQMKKFAGDKANNWQKRPHRRNPPSSRSFSEHFKDFSSLLPAQVLTFDPS